MKKEIVQKWINGLRSGKYKKICGVMKASSRRDFDHTEEKLYCAFGVLFEEIGIPSRQPEYTTVFEFEIGKYKVWRGVPRELLMIILGVDEDTAKIISTDIIHFNDTVGANFNQIATYLETHCL